MPPNEPCPRCGELILDWHDEWYGAAQMGVVQISQSLSLQAKRLAE
jgi:hypothetical protein